MQVHLSRPDITEEEKAAVNAVLQSPILAMGPKTLEFEEAIARYVGCRHGVAVNSGTSGLHLLRPGFRASAAATRSSPRRSASSPRATAFSMSGPSRSLSTSTRRPATSIPIGIEGRSRERTKAILPVDVFGQPADLDAIAAIARRHGLVADRGRLRGARLDVQGLKTGTAPSAQAGGLRLLPEQADHHRRRRDDRHRRRSDSRRSAAACATRGAARRRLAHPRTPRLQLPPG